MGHKTTSDVTTRVRAPDVDDWRKLGHLMEYLRVDRLCPLILSADGSGVLMWYVDIHLLCILICAAILVECSQWGEVFLLIVPPS